ncbi:MAG: hypothetical protein HY216_12640 [Candidatus Rokubacteria bacterium]|nr:hypothetical protein [Candidatus Rokubacteria bacterium]
MAAFALRLVEDRLAPGAAMSLAARPRVLYVRAGLLDVGDTAIGADTVWHGAGACRLTTGGDGATVLRYELAGGRFGAAPATAAAHVTSRLVLEHALALDPAAPYLMRCDRVDFAPGGEALPHGHRGGGIRYLIAGTLEVRVGNGAVFRGGIGGAAPLMSRVMRPGDAWFESGAEPVHAIADKKDATAFIRVAILPRELRGKTSIVYADPAHAAIKPRKYTVFVDEPIEIA